MPPPGQVVNTRIGRCGCLLRGHNVYKFEELKRERLTILAISEMNGLDRKTARRYLLEPAWAPAYGPRTNSPLTLEPHTVYSTTAGRGRLECPGVDAGAARTRLCRRLHAWRGWPQPSATCPFHSNKYSRRRRPVWPRASLRRRPAAGQAVQRASWTAQ